MIIIPFLIAGISYAISASLPFLVSKTTQMWIGAFIGIVANLAWTSISRSVPQNDIPIYSLYFDFMLLIIYTFWPFFFIDFSLTTKQLLGIITILIGFFLVKG